MYVFLVVLLQVHFVINEKQEGQYVLYQNPNTVMGNGAYKLTSLQKDDNVNKIQDAIGSRWLLGVVPYYFDIQSYDDIIAERLRSAINILESESCLKFSMLSEKPNNITWIHITNPNRERVCVHEINNNKDGEITLVLGYECLKENELLHTLLHAIGLNDEVTHPHRDRYIRVLWNNILPEHRKLYKVQPQDESKTLGEYDPLSVMHFHDRAFSSNGQATIMPLISGLMINPSEELSQLDKMKLRILFEHECNKRKVGDLLDSCKNAFNTKLKDSIEDKSDAQGDDLDNSHNDDTHDTKDKLKDSLGDNSKSSDKDNDNENGRNELKCESEVEEHSQDKDQSVDQSDIDQDRVEDESKETF